MINEYLSAPEWTRGGSAVFRSNRRTGIRINNHIYPWVRCYAGTGGICFARAGGFRGMGCRCGICGIVVGKAVRAFKASLCGETCLENQLRGILIGRNNEMIAGLLCDQKSINERSLPAGRMPPNHYQLILITKVSKQHTS
jgi:hypothetical protein